MPYTLSRKRTTDCLWPGMRPEGISDFGRSSPAAGFWRVNLKLSTPCRSSNGTRDLRIARALSDSFLPYKKLCKFLTALSFIKLLKQHYF